ncbi:MAG: PKD domain-containing protein [Alphaproteobacteria bacterium]
MFDALGSTDPDGGLLLYRWDFGDGTGDDSVNPTKTYDIGKIYPVTLTVRDESGLPSGVHSDRIAVRVKESPLAVAGPDQTVCAGSEVRFDGSGSRDFDGIVNRFAWNFGDGREGGGERPVHVYEQPGAYRVALTIWGDEGGQCDSSHTDEMTVLVQPAPAVEIAAPSAAAAGSTVTFDARRALNLASADDLSVTMAQATDAVPSAAASDDRLRWDFGDGTSGEGALVEHVFEKPGSYVVILTREASDAGAACTTATARHVITVNAGPLAVAGADRRAAPGEELLFDASASSDPDGAIERFFWDFGDGATGSGVQARHRFAAPGSYPVTLTVDDGAGLANSRATTLATVQVNAAPEPRIDAPAVACVGEKVAFDAGGSSDSDGKIEKIAWDFGDGTPIEEPATTRLFGRPGHYDIGLTVDDGSGLLNATAGASTRLHVNRPPAAAAGPDRLACPGSAITFDAGGSRDPDGELAAWVWDFGDGTSASGSTATHSYAEPGDYRVLLTVSDDSGSNCASASDVATVTVNSPPTAMAEGDASGFVGGAHDVVQFDASRSSDADGGPLGYVWDLGDGLSATGETVRHGYLRAGSYRVTLTASDGTGLPCGSATDQLDVAIRQRAR